MERAIGGAPRDPRGGSRLPASPARAAKAAGPVAASVPAADRTQPARPPAPEPSAADGRACANARAGDAERVHSDQRMAGPRGRRPRPALGVVHGVAAGQGRRDAAGDDGRTGGSGRGTCHPPGALRGPRGLRAGGLSAMERRAHRWGLRGRPPVVADSSGARRRPPPPAPPRRRCPPDHLLQTESLCASFPTF